MRSKQIIREVAAKHQVTRNDILGRFKNGAIPAARREVMVRLKALGMTAPQIGRIVKRDASTVLYHVSPRINEHRRARKKALYALQRRAAR